MLDAVRDYWEQNPCAAKLATAPAHTPAFYADVAEAKDRLEPYRGRFADPLGTRGKRVLEIGVGLGIDLARFAAAGATVSGVDLTQAGIDSTGELLRQDGLTGDLRVADAAALPFDDGSFDVVYSWGVLHHAPDVEACIAEAARVLKPGGAARVMLYNRRSWFALAVWGRQITRERRPMTVAGAVARGLESPGTKALTAGEARAMFSRHFSDVIIRRRATAYDRKVVGPLAVNVAGWHLLILAHA